MSQYAIQPIEPADEERYKRRYKAIQAVVDDLSDESNLLALKVARIQARIYSAHMAAHGVPPPAVPLPEGATWGPLVQNATAIQAGGPGAPVPVSDAAAPPDPRAIDLASPGSA